MQDWVGSITAANNPGRDEPEAGLSRLEDGRLAEMWTYRNTGT